MEAPPSRGRYRIVRPQGALTTPALGLLFIYPSVLSAAVALQPDANVELRGCGRAMCDGPSPSDVPGVFTSCVKNATAMFDAVAPMQGPDPNEIAIVQFETRVDEPLYRDLMEHTRRYAKHHGYRYFLTTQRLLNETEWHASWERVPALLRALSTPGVKYAMWLGSDVVIYDFKRPVTQLINAAGLTDGSAFLIAGDDSPMFQWKVPPLVSKLQGDAYIWSASDSRSHEMLAEMLATAGEWKQQWDLDQYRLNALYNTNTTLRDGVRWLPFCSLAGTDCRNSTLKELDGQKPFIYHCLHGFEVGPDSKENLPRVLRMAQQAEEALAH